MSFAQATLLLAAVAHRSVVDTITAKSVGITPFDIEFGILVGSIAASFSMIVTSAITTLGSAVPRETCVYF